MTMLDLLAMEPAKAAPIPERNQVIYVGVIQTSLDYEAAWVDEKNGTWQDCVRISCLEELRAKREIRHYLASLEGLGRRADIVLLPELAVPIGFERQLKRAAETLEAIIIAGLDYQIEAAEPVPTVSNEAVIIVPSKLNGRRIARRTEIRRVGKTYPSPAEGLSRSLLIFASAGFRCDSMRPARWTPLPWLPDDRGPRRPS